jgi:ABC-2 type transport system permease protein
MFREIYAFELRTAFRRPTTYLYFGILFLLTMLIGMAASEVFDTTRSDSLTIRNSAGAIAGILLGTSSSIFGILVSILLIASMATVIQKDYEYNMHPLFFTKPVSKPGYFLGRFLGGFTVAVFIFAGLLAGYWAGSLFGMGKPVMGEYRLVNYLEPFLLFTLPNILFLGVLFFSLTTFLRTTMASYIVAIVLMVLQIASDNITANIDNKTLAALLEPSGAQALQKVTQYWSPAERNTNLIPLRDEILYNRLIWMGVSLLIGAISYRGFRFSQFLQPIRLFGKAVRAEAPARHSALTLESLPKVDQTFDTATAWRQTLHLTRLELRRMLASVFYIVMCLLAVGMLFLILKFMDSMYESSTWLVTYKVVENVQGATAFFSLIFVLFHSGTSLWRDREARMQELVGVTPVGNGSLFLSKLLAFTVAMALMQALVSIAGIGIQLYSGFTDIDFSQYLTNLLMSAAVGVVFIALALSVQTYAANKYLAFFLTIIPLIVIPILSSIFEWSYPLLDFNGTGTSMPYSDMNGYGNTLPEWMVYRGFWLSFAAALCLLALIVYPRGSQKGIRDRWRLSAHFNGPRLKASIATILLVAAASAGFIHYQTRILADVRKPKDREKDAADLEKRFSRFKALPQPRITAVSLEVDIHPEDRTLDIKGLYTLRNKTARAIDTLYIDYPSGRKSPYHYPVFKPNVPARIAIDDKEHGIRVYALAKPLLPGDSIGFAFEMQYIPNGLFARSGSPVIDNGTFLNSSLLPSIGYLDDAELSQNKARKEYGLGPKPRMARVDDSAALMNNYISRDADWIRFEATVSTVEGQRAIAPGYLVKDWKKDGRHYFQYRMDSPILHFFSFLSARYELRKDRWNDVAIEVWYNKGHEYNIDRMIKGIKRGLDYYTKHFGPYQHRQVRILEFPRYASFAQSFPNTIPFSEAIGFISKVGDGEEDIDVPFYVTAHEVAHQWWAHQVIGGDVQGSVLMSETMSQYSALMVMQQEYGKEAMRKFLKYEMDRYLMGRVAEWRGEMPLMLVENQQYIHYNKGSIVMYALQDYIGEERLNGAIRTYLEKTRFSGPPYTNSIDFVNHIRAVTPDTLQYLVTDLFEKITIYENYVKSLDTTRLPDGRYRVKLTVGSAKFYADSLGKESKAEVADLVDVAVFGTKMEKGKERQVTLVSQRIWMDKPEKSFEWVLKEKPHSAGIDPNHLLIDRNAKNNSARFGEKPVVPDLKPGGNPVMMFMNGKEE